MAAARRWKVPIRRLRHLARPRRVLDLRLRLVVVGSSRPSSLVLSPATVAAANPSGLPSVNKAKASTNAQKLTKALKVCDKKPKKQRAGCKKQAEKKYATTKKKKS